MNSQIKSRQISHHGNQPNNGNPNVKQKVSQNHSSTKKPQQVLSQNVTPKQKKPKASTKKFSNLHFKENEQYQAVFMQRKKSLDYQLYCKSTKVSPQRLSNAPNSQIPLQVKYNNQQVPSYDNYKQQQLNESHNVSQYNLRLSQNELERQNINTISYHNNEIEGIKPNLISHTHGFQNTKTSLTKQDCGSATVISAGAQRDPTDDIESSIHQSFINLIYPSKSKKIMGIESYVKQMDGTENIPITSNHQKSKSLFIGGNTLNLGTQMKHNMQQLNQKGVQKVQQSCYKKQASIFNYSQRLKELLNDTINEESHQYKNPFQKHQILSQQHSPMQSQSHIIVNMQDIQCQQRSTERDPTENHMKNHHAKLLKSTFDKILSQNQQYLTINEQINLQKGQGVNQTIDYIQQKKQQQQMNSFLKANTSQNTPNNHQNNIITLKPKLESQPSKTHLRKPSLPLNNNFMKDSGQQLSFLKENSVLCTRRDSQKISSSKQNSQERIDQRQPSIEPKQIAQNIQNQFQIIQNTQMYQPVREKKQHQPTQSKILQGSNKQSHHQRSQSDYINYQFFEQQQQQMNLQQSESEQKIRKSSPKINVNQQQQVQQQISAAKPSMVLNNSKGILQKDHNQKSVNSQLRSSQITSPISQNINNSLQYKNYLSLCINCQQDLSLLKNMTSLKQTNANNQAQKTKQICQGCSANMSQQQQMALNSLNFSQQMNISSQQNSLHSSSAAVLNHQRSNSDLKQQIIMQATKRFQNQAMNKPSHILNTSTKQNSASFIVAPQQQIDRYQKEIRSEKVSPIRDNKQDQNKKKSIANVSIDLYKGVVVVNGSQPPSAQNQTIPIQRQPSSKTFQLKPQFSNNNNTQSFQNSLTRRKNSFIQQPIPSTSRQSSPNTVKMNNQSRGTLINSQSQINDIAVNNISTIPQRMNDQRYSIQHSPIKQISLFQKTKKQSLHLKNPSMGNIHFNPQQQYNAFQQQQKMTQHNQTVLSPSNKSSSFTQFKGMSNNKSINTIEFTDDSILMSGKQNKKFSVQPNILINEFNNAKIIKNVNQQSEKQLPITESELLLNQIRNNIMQQKGYKISETIVQQQQPQFNQKSKKNNLQRITEASVEHFPIETFVDNNPKIKEQRKKPQINVNDQQTNFINLQTDPNMSPYSKDVFKLQKMIKFNFKKYNEPPTTSSEFYRIGRVLGRGAFGKVNLAAHKVSEQLVAIKSINKEFLKSEEDQRKKIMQEFAILKQSNHTSVVRLYDSFETNKHICFVMELCSGGDLLTYVRKRRKLNEDVAKHFFKQIIEGLAYIHHSKLIVHRDIKLDNILLDANGRIKICDFGVSRQVHSENERMTEQCGTPAYIAPEILRDKGYEGFKVDVWSAGVCLYAMLIGTVPFKAASMHELHHLIINGKYEITEPKMSEHAKNLIQQLLQVDPRKRLSAYEVLSHPWLKDAQDEMDIFTQKEKDTIQKEYLSKNIERINRNSQIQVTNQDTEAVFTEHNLDTKTNGNSLMKNASTKSIILAPFNSTVSDFDEEKYKKEKYEWPEEIKRMMVPKKVLKFNPKCKDLDRQYEQNNNADLDNGVYNNFANEQEEENKSQNQQNSSSSSQDSLKKSFKETELSSDDEKAELQVEEARKQQQQQQSELQEFEKQIKMKYVKYQEPIEVIQMDIVEEISNNGIYPKEYLVKCLNNKDMNYATATYHLFSKKKQLLQKLNSEGHNGNANE